MSEHRVSVLSATLRHHPDPLRSRDPRVQAVLAELKTLNFAPAPRAHFRAELRAQLVAVAPRLVREGIAAETPIVDVVPRPSPIPKAERPQPKAAARHTDHDGVLARLRRLPIGRPLAIAATLVAAFALLLGGAVLMSKNALPGDTLYSLKRASEQVELATTSSPTEKANYYLDFAKTRVDEVSSLLKRSTTSAAGPGAHASGGVNSSTAKLITSTLASADTDVRSASKLLGTQAVKRSSAKPLAAMTDWAPGQLQRLHQVAAALPTGDLRARADSSAQLVTAALARASALRTTVGCACMNNAATDELGPVPCTTCATPGVTVPKDGRTTTRHPTTTAPSAKPHQGPAGPSPDTVSPDPQPAGSPTPAPTTTRPGIVLPSLPIKLPTTVPTLPVDLKSCSASVNLGLIQIQLGTCPSGSSSGP
ncbi:MAG TPA: DUF5667 domain-containing protein [Jatrophihabitans sp.]|nr:DUF5667 domain-containing protein [Jatrophihabitans sp.]